MAIVVTKIEEKRNKKKEMLETDLVRRGLKVRDGRARVIHEHDFLPMGTFTNFIQCRTCEAAYCMLCGKRIATVVTRRDHGIGKCVRSDMYRPKVPFQ